MPTSRRYSTTTAKQRAYRERQVQARRAEIRGLPPAPPLSILPNLARWDALLGQAQLSLETVRDEMQAYHDARSESWQQGDSAQEMQERIDALDRLLDGLDDVLLL